MNNNSMHTFVMLLSNLSWLTFDLPIRFNSRTWRSISGLDTAHTKICWLTHITKYYITIHFKFPPQGFYHFDIYDLLLSIDLLV